MGQAAMLPSLKNVAATAAGPPHSPRKPPPLSLTLEDRRGDGLALEVGAALQTHHPALLGCSAPPSEARWSAWTSSHFLPFPAWEGGTAMGPREAQGPACHPHQGLASNLPSSS